MGEIYIQFEGICTHFRQPDNPKLPVLHRVVVPALQDISFAFGKTFDPHRAYYRIHEDGTDIPLDGVSFTIENPTPGKDGKDECTYEESYGAIPRLGDLMRETGRELGEPSPAAMLGANRGLAAAYFDFNSATFHACSTAVTGDLGGAVAWARVETDGDPIVSMRPFPSSLLAAADAPAPITLPTGTTIYISNESDTAMGGEYDFLLSYLLADHVPQDPPRPKNVMAPVCAVVRKHKTGGSFDIFCSNSNYP
jgi:hypothetical protein